MVKILNTAGSKFASLDMFGHPITVFFRGGDVYRTKLGALLTILVYSTVLCFTTFGLIDLVTMGNPDIAIIRK